MVPSKHKRRLGEDNQNSRSENANPRLTTTAAIKTLSIAYSAMVIARSSSRTPVAAELLPQLRLLGWRLGVRGDGALLSQTQHDTITPGGQSPMCWRSPKIQTHVLAITKNANLEDCHRRVSVRHDHRRGPNPDRRPSQSMLFSAAPTPKLFSVSVSLISARRRD